MEPGKEETVLSREEHIAKQLEDMSAMLANFGYPEEPAPTTAKNELVNVLDSIKERQDLNIALISSIGYRLGLILNNLR